MSVKQVLNFEVSQSNFESIVLMNSYKLPVVTLFMSPSIVTCIQMENIISGLASDFASQFLLARIDIDMDVDLKDKYEITNVPTIKIFVNGEVVHHEIGFIDESEMTAILKSFGVFRESDDLREAASVLNASGDTNGAIQKLTEAIKLDPSNTRVVLDMTQILLDINVVEEAVRLFNRLPDKAKSSDQGKLIIGQVTFKNLALKTPGLESLIETVTNNPDDIDSRFYLSVCYLAERKFDDALIHAYKVLSEQVDYRDGAAQELIVTMIEMLEMVDKESANTARRKLANILSS